MICTGCGTLNSDGAKFCDNCGTKLSAAPQPPIETFTQAQPQSAPPTSSSPQSPPYPMPGLEPTSPPQPPTQQLPPITYSNPNLSIVQPPTGYSAQPPIPPPPPSSKKPPEKKDGSKMKKKTVMIVVVIILLAWFVVGGIIFVAMSVLGGENVDSNDPALGVWEATGAAMTGVDIDIDTVFSGGMSMTLKEDGSFLMVIGEEEGSGKWEYSEEGSNEFTFSGSGLDGIGVIEGSSMILKNVEDTGIDVIFEKEGSFAGQLANGSDIDGSADMQTALQERWEAPWYGVMYVDAATGRYADYESAFKYVYLVTDINADNTGLFSIYSTTGDQTAFMAGSCEVKDGLEDGLYVTQASMMGVDQASAPQWRVEVDRTGIEDAYYMSAEVYDSNGYYMMFSLYLMPWNHIWQQEEVATNFPDIPQEEGIRGEGAEPLYTTEDATAIASSDLIPALGPVVGTSTDNSTQVANGTANATEIISGTYWYGTMVIEDYSGPIERQPVRDIWAEIMTTENGRSYFQVYDTPNFEDAYPIYSSWIDIHGDGFTADMSDGEAWVLERSLLVEDEAYFSPRLDDGVLDMSYRYLFNQESFNIRFYLRLDGAPWDESRDVLPPSYEQYKELIG